MAISDRFTHDGFTFDASGFERIELALLTNGEYLMDGIGMSRLFDFCALALKGWPFEGDPINRASYDALTMRQIYQLVIVFNTFVDRVARTLTAKPANGIGPNRRERRRLEALNKNGRK